MNLYKKKKLTPLDDPAIRIQMESVFEEIIKECTAIDPSFTKDICQIHTLPSGEISAIIVSNTWDSSYCILVSREIFIFTLMISKLVSFCYNSSFNEKRKKLQNIKLSAFFGLIDFCDNQAKNQAKSNIQFKQIVEELFENAIYSGYVTLTKPWFIPNQCVTLYASNLKKSMDDFIIAHEAAHGLCGHLKKENLTTVSSGLLQDKDVFITSHAHEYEADHVGLLLLIKSYERKKYSPVQAICGAYIFLKAIEVLHNCYDIHKHSIGGILSTHPHPSNRAQRVKKLSLKLYNKSKYKQQIERCCTGVDSIFYWINKHAMQNIKIQKQAGRLPKEKKLVSTITMDKPQILGITPDRVVNKLILSLEQTITT